ncbi:MAG: PspC domain-containing protein [Ignavibacteriaceae bacterium]|nr:PspC domain-containing protein [Ignavibacteriaceae bacterium]
MTKTLHRSIKNKVIGGVAGGLAEYFDIDPVLVRVLFVVSFLFHGAGLLAYIVLWIAVPQAQFVFEAGGSFKSENTAGTTSSTDNPQNDDAAAKYFKSLEDKKLSRNRNLGIILVVLGCIFLADIFIPRIHFADFWPLILIAIGISLLLNSKKV